MGRAPMVNVHFLVGSSASHLKIFFFFPFGQSGVFFGSPAISIAARLSGWCGGGAAKLVDGAGCIPPTRTPPPLSSHPVRAD
jgi:hypothetical protein